MVIGWDLLCFGSLTTGFVRLMFVGNISAQKLDGILLG